MRNLLILLPLLWFPACGEDATSPVTNRTYAIVLHSPTDGGTLTSYALASTGLLSDPISSVPAVGSYRLGASAATKQIYTLVDFDITSILDPTFLRATTLDPATGFLSPPDFAALVQTGSPTLTVHPQGKFVYVPRSAEDFFVAFEVDAKTKGLSSIDVTATGHLPGGSAVHPNGRFLYMSNTADSTISWYSIAEVDGVLALVGSTGTTGATVPDEMTICPAGKFLYVLGNNKVSAFSINADAGTLTLVPGSPFATGAVPAAVRVDPAGKFLYVANKGTANISVFSINADTGVLTEISGSPFAAGGTLASMAFNPSGALLYVPDGASKIYVYQIEAATGALTALAGSPQTLADGPARIEILQVTL